MNIVIHHNPDCGTSRTALRTTKSPADELGLLDPAVPDEKLIDADGKPLPD